MTTPDLTIESHNRTYAFVICHHCDLRQSVHGPAFGTEYATKHAHNEHLISKPAIRRVRS